MQRALIVAGVEYGKLKPVIKRLAYQIGHCTTWAPCVYYSADPLLAFSKWEIHANSLTTRIKYICHRTRSFCAVVY
jgi:hypothetical protein